MTPTNPKVNVIDTTPSMVTTRFLWNKDGMFPNVERNDTSSKPIADPLNIVLDIYKFL